MSHTRGMRPAASAVGGAAWGWGTPSTRKTISVSWRDCPSGQATTAVSGSTAGCNNGSGVSTALPARRTLVGASSVTVGPASASSNSAASRTLPRLTATCCGPFWRSADW